MRLTLVCGLVLSLVVPTGFAASKVEMISGNARQAGVERIILKTNKQLGYTNGQTIFEVNPDIA